MEGFDFGKSFSFIFQDPQWVKKVLIAGAVMLIPILGWIWLAGYAARMAQNYVNGWEHPLGEWDDFSGDVSRGFQLFLVGLVWTIPFIGLMVGVLVVVAAESGSDEFAQMGGLLVQCISIPFLLLMQVALPAPMIHVAMTGRFGAGFEFGKLWSYVRGNLTPYVLAGAVGFLANMAAGFGYLACLIGTFFTIAAATLIRWHAHAQVWKLNMERTGQEPQIAETFT